MALKPGSGNLSTLRRAVGLLSPPERRKGVMVLMLMIATAFLEMLGVAAVFPFLGVLADPAAIGRNAYLSWAYEMLRFSSPTGFLLLLGGLAVTMIVLAAVARTVTLYAITRFNAMRRHTISTRLLQGYLRQPYAFYLDRHTGDLAKGILSEVAQVIANVFQPAANVIAQGLTLTAMVILLFVADPAIATVAAVTLGGAYVLIYLALRRFVERIGTARVAANRAQFQIAGEALAGIKDIRLLGREQAYLRRYAAASRDAARYQSAALTLSQVPKFGIEALAFGGIVLLALVVLLRDGGAGSGTLARVIPILGLYTLAGYKMLPAIQTVYRGAMQLRFGAAAVDALCADMNQVASLPPLPGTPARPLPLTRNLELEALRYTYPAAAAPGITDLSLRITAGQSLGIVGTTGAGKTTLVDLLLGLLTPDAGRRLADGVEITPANLRAWQANIGYVPQSIFLVAASVAENIALGLPPEQIDRARVEACAKMARIHDFVTGTLPRGYDTDIGERGLRLSGGQRQRIGIARALYRDPALVVFDEATSALDTATEAEVMEAITALAGTKTVILIAHRLSTVERCDKIIMLNQGRIVGEGRYDELLAHCPAFRTMAGQAPQAEPATLPGGVC